MTSPENTPQRIAETMALKLVLTIEEREYVAAALVEYGEHCVQEDRERSRQPLIVQLRRERLDARRIAEDCVSKIKSFPKGSVQPWDTIQEIIAAALMEYGEACAQSEKSKWMLTLTTQTRFLRDDSRRAALEEAAKLVEKYPDDMISNKQLACEIRALKEKDTRDKK